MDTWVWLWIITLIFASLSAWVAWLKGRSLFLWFCVGLFLGPIGLLASRFNPGEREIPRQIIVFVTILYVSVFLISGAILYFVSQPKMSQVAIFSTFDIIPQELQIARIQYYSGIILLLLGLLIAIYEGALSIQKAAATASTSSVSESPHPSINSPSEMSAAILEQKLQEWCSLHDKGLITDDELSEKRRQILGL